MTHGSFKHGLKAPRCSFSLACNFHCQRYRGMLATSGFIYPSLQVCRNFFCLFQHIGCYPGLSSFPSKAHPYRPIVQSSKLLFLPEPPEAHPCRIGLHIALDKQYGDIGVFEVDAHEQRLTNLLSKHGGQTVKGYANLIWFAEQVSW